MTKPNQVAAVILSAIALGLFAYTGRAYTQTSNCRTINVLSSIDSVVRNADICKWGDDDSPLLVFFSAWSGAHPYFEEILKLVSNRRWNIVAPKPRGANEGEIGSTLAIQDVLDSIRLFKKQGGLLPKRIFAIGVSGGGYMALMMAAKYPELFHGVSVWAAMTDLRFWREEILQRNFISHQMYGNQIYNALGDPGENSAIYIKASPVNFSNSLRSVKIDLNAGLTDGYHGPISVSHSLKLYDDLSDPHDQLSTDNFVKLTSGDKSLFLTAVRDDSYRPKKVLFRKTSAKVRLTVHDGDHEMVPTAAINWLSLQ